MKKLKRIIFTACLIVFVSIVNFSIRHAESTTIALTDKSWYNPELSEIAKGSDQANLASESKTADVLVEPIQKTTALESSNSSTFFNRVSLVNLIDTHDWVYGRSTKILKMAKQLCIGYFLLKTSKALRDKSVVKCYDWVS